MIDEIPGIEREGLLLDSLTQYLSVWPECTTSRFLPFLSRRSS
jgi:hypothetical protein